MQHGLQLASGSEAEYAIVIGEEELKTNTVKLKNMATRETDRLHIERPGRKT